MSPQNISLIKKTKEMKAWISEEGGRLPHEDINNYRKIKKRGNIKRKQGIVEVKKELKMSVVFDVLRRHKKSLPVGEEESQLLHWCSEYTRLR